VVDTAASGSKQRPAGPPPPPPPPGRGLQPTGEYITDNGKVEKGMPVEATEVQVGKDQKLLATERALWAFRAQVRANAQNSTALRELLLGLTQEQRAQLWTVYDKNHYLGDDAPLDPRTKLKLKFMMEELAKTGV
jgi:hypothetical protein